MSRTSAGPSCPLFRLSPPLAAFLLAAAAPAASGDQPFPSDMECVAQPHYCRRSDGKPGREITLNLKGDKLAGKAQVEVMVNGRTETVKLPSVAGGPIGWVRPHSQRR